MYDIPLGTSSSFEDSEEAVETFDDWMVDVTPGEYHSRVRDDIKESKAVDSCSSPTMVLIWVKVGAVSSAIRRLL